jgi:HEAT repeat protein
LLAVTLGLLGSFAGAAQAQPRAKPPVDTKPTDSKPTIDAAAIRAKLGGSTRADSARLLEGLAEAQAAGAGAAAVAPAIEQLLKKGTIAAAARAALEALGAIGAPASSAVIRPYLKHRIAEVRRAAARALGSTKGAEAALAFKEGLRSSDGMVRGFSASGLGSLGQVDALPDLFVALDRGVAEAAAAIGMLCGADDCDRFVSKLTRVSFDVMTSGLDPILFRQKPLPDAEVLKIVRRIGDLATPQARRYLTDVAGRWPAAGSAKVKEAIEGAIAIIPVARGEAR